MIDNDKNECLAGRDKACRKKFTEMKPKISFYDRKMVIPIKRGVDACYYGELMYVKFDKPYCILHFTGSKKYKVEISLKEMMDNLPQNTFFKCKRSAILNICYFRSFSNNPPMITMDDGAKFELSKQNVQFFNQIKINFTRISPPCHSCYTCKYETCKNRVLFCHPTNHSIEPTEG